MSEIYKFVWVVCAMFSTYLAVCIHSTEIQYYINKLIFQTFERYMAEGLKTTRPCRSVAFSTNLYYKVE